MAGPPTFIMLEGLLAESGEFRLERGYEDSQAEAGLRFGTNAHAVVFALIDGTGQTLASVKPNLRFPVGCTPDATPPAWGLLRAALAWNADARAIELRMRDRLLFSVAIAATRPSLEDVAVSVAGEIATISFDAQGEQSDIRLLARLSDGRRIRPPATRTSTGFTVDLGALQGMVEAMFVIEATSGFRTTRALTAPVALPPASVNGIILEPSSGESWPFGWRASLIGGLFDGNGRRLDWSQHRCAWLVDGEPIVGNGPIVPWEAGHPGEHSIRLIREHDNGQFEVLAEVSVVVLPPTQEQLEYAALIASRKPSFP